MTIEQKIMVSQSKWSPMTVDDCHMTYKLSLVSQFVSQKFWLYDKALIKSSFYKIVASEMHQHMYVGDNYWRRINSQLAFSFATLPWFL